MWGRAVLSMLAIANGRVLTITQGVIERGTVLVDGTKIAAVGPDLALPEGAQVVDATGKTVMPGLVEAHCHLGFMDMMDLDQNGAEDRPGGGEGGLGPAVTPHFDYFYAFNPRSPQLAEAARGGVTTVLTGPGSGKVISGLNLVAKTTGKTADEMILRYPAGVKTAFGENPKRNFGSRNQMPSTRMGTAALWRGALVRARAYMAKQDRAHQVPSGQEQAPQPPPHDLELEPLVKLLRGELVARVHAHRADDIMTVLRIADEFGIKLTLEHATEAYKIADEVARRNIPCVFGPTMVTRLKVELRDITFAGAGQLERAGIKVALTTDAPVVAVEFLRTAATLAFQEGMSEAGALAAITINAAEIAGVAERVGSLEPGKDADLVVLDGHPLSYLSRIEQVFVNGRRVYDAATYLEPWEKE